MALEILNIDYRNRSDISPSSLATVLYDFFGLAILLPGVILLGFSAQVQVARMRVYF
jgi:nitrogen fixation/metabolism regulation signal transduction histidine kinase